jgi:hypothetical protein
LERVERKDNTLFRWRNEVDRSELPHALFTWYQAINPRQPLTRGSLRAVSQIDRCQRALKTGSPALSMKIALLWSGMTKNPLEKGTAAPVCGLGSPRVQENPF